MLKFLFRLFVCFVLRLAPREAVILSGSRHRGAELSFYLPDGRSLDTNGCFGGIQNPIFRTLFLPTTRSHHLSTCLSRRLTTTRKSLESVGRHVMNHMLSLSLYSMLSVASSRLSTLKQRKSDSLGNSSNFKIRRQPFSPFSLPSH